MGQLKAAEGCCEEASILSRETYIPCNRPAKFNVYAPVEKRTYRMCEPCAIHNEANRGCKVVGPYDGV